MSSFSSTARGRRRAGGLARRTVAAAAVLATGFAALASLGATQAEARTTTGAEISSSTTASTAAARAAAVAPRPKFQLPFRCNQVWRADSYSSDHAPALDLTYLPQSGTAGKLVLAAAGGTVKESGYQTGSGNYVLINHGNKWFTVYIHLRSRLVRAGQRVATGTAIGYVGNTGTLSNGVNHLHFEELYNANGDNYLDWGRKGGERVAVTFNGSASARDVKGAVRAYGRAGGTWHIASHNACTGAPPAPPAPSKYYATTFSAAPGYSRPGGTRTGTLNKGRDYFYCKVAGPRVQHGSDWNHWWLRTDLDSGNPWRNQYVSAYYLAKWGNDQAKDDSGRVIKTC